MAFIPFCNSICKFKRQQFSNIRHLLISFCSCISCCTYVIEHKNVNISKKEKHVASFDEVVETRFCCSVNVIVSRWVSSKAPLSLFRLLRAVGTSVSTEWYVPGQPMTGRSIVPLTQDKKILSWCPSVPERPWAKWILKISKKRTGFLF